MPLAAQWLCCISAACLVARSLGAEVSGYDGTGSESRSLVEVVDDDTCVSDHQACSVSFRQLRGDLLAGEADGENHLVDDADCPKWQESGLVGGPASAKDALETRKGKMIYSAPKDLGQRLVSDKAFKVQYVGDYGQASYAKVLAGQGYYVGDDGSVLVGYNGLTTDPPRGGGRNGGRTSPQDPAPTMHGGICHRCTEHRVANQTFKTTYLRMYVKIVRCQGYWVDADGKVCVGWHGTTDPPAGMDGMSMC